MTLSAGVIGLGFIGRAQVDALRRLPGVQVIAAAGSGPHINQAAAALGIPKAYTNYQDLIADPDVNVVHNCTPNHLHFDINRITLEAGKACYAEKPLTITTAQAEELVRLARAKNASVAVNFNHRAFPQVQHARALIAAGEIGNVYTVHGNYLQDWLLHDTAWNWRVDPQLGGPSRTVADIGSHWMDLAQSVTGARIVELMADLHTAIPIRYPPARRLETFERADTRGEPVHIASEDFASVLLRFSNGAHGVFSVSQISAGHKNQLLLEVDGAGGALAWNSQSSEHLWRGSRDAPVQVIGRDPAQALVGGMSTLPAGHAEGWNDALRTAIAGFYATLRGEPAPPWLATWEDGLRAVALTEAILESHRQRHWVSVA
jgi:predicted dehydrogenase